MGELFRAAMTVGAVILKEVRWAGIVGVHLLLAFFSISRTDGMRIDSIRSDCGRVVNECERARFHQPRGIDLQHIRELAAAPDLKLNAVVLQSGESMG